MTVRLGSVAPVGFRDFADPAWLGCMRKLGCTSVQVYRNRNGNDDDPSRLVTPQQMLDYVAAGQLPCDSLHGLYGNDLDPSSPDESARRQAVDTFKAEGDLARMLGGPIVVVHCAGIAEPGRSVSPDEAKRRWEQLTKSIRELADFGRAQQVRYAFENLPPYHFIGAEVSELARRIQRIDDPFVGMCFDVAHAKLAGNPIQAAEAAAETTVYVHICDNHGRADEHLMPFQGRIDWSAFAATLRRWRYDGVLMLEVFPQLDELRRFVDEGLGEKLAAFLAKANSPI